MNEENIDFRAWLKINHPNVQLLMDNEATINGVHFFGGTMWTDFSDANADAMIAAQQGMNDFRMIMKADRKLLQPLDTMVIPPILIGVMCRHFFIG